MLFNSRKYLLRAFHPGRLVSPATALSMLVVALPAFSVTLPAYGEVSQLSVASSLDDIIDELPQPLNDADFIDAGNHAAARFELGRHLFFDPVLSGNRNISCGTCHDPATGTSDAVALSIGEGGRGQGRERQVDEGVTGRVPRNAQSLYNVGALEYRSFFHDGRLNTNSTHVHGAGFTSPDSERIPDDPPGLLARQALFPVTSAVEMAGQPGENPVADAVDQYQLSGTDGARNLIARRLRELPDYVTLFREDRFSFRTPSLRNVALSGPWGHAGSYDSLEDVVRHHLDPIASLESYSLERAERTLSPLLNVLDSIGRGPTRVYYPLDAARLPAFNHRRGFVQGSDTLRSRIARHNDLSPVRLRDDEVDALIAFLHTLTDPESRDQSHLIPRHLPSGLEPQPMPVQINQ